MRPYRLAVLADIHGNLPAFEAVLTDLNSFAPIDRILVAGDITTGPLQSQVLRMLQELDAFVIQGNSEDWMCDYDNHALAEFFYTIRQYDLGRWGYNHLNREELNYLHGLPKQAVFALPGADPIRVVHGSPQKINEGIGPDTTPDRLKEILSEIDEAAIVCGHTHVPWQAKVNGRVVLNPGAVCSPLDGQTGAQYALLEWSGIAWKAVRRHVSYDLAVIRKQFIETGLYDATCLARAYLAGILTGRDASRDFIAHAKQVAQQEGCADLPYFPDPVWERAENTFDWSEWPC